MKILAGPTNRVFQGAAERRCPLCRCNLALSVNSLVGEANCPNCGLDVKKLETSRLEPTPLKPAPAKPSTDPLERWLSGDALEPKSRSEWEHVALWIRQHPRLSGLAAALLIAAIVVPIGLFFAYSRTAVSLQQAAAARTAAEQQQLELSATMERNAAELKMHQERLQTQQQEHEWLKNQFRELQSNYQQSQQQIRIAENLLHGTASDSRQAPAEQASAASPAAAPSPSAVEPAPAPVVQSNPPATIPAPVPAVQFTLPVVIPTLPSAALAPPPSVRHLPPIAVAAPVESTPQVAPVASPAPLPEIQPNPPTANLTSPAADVASINTAPITTALVEAPPAEVIQLLPPAADLAPVQVPVQEFEHTSPAASAFAVQQFQPAPAHSSLVLIRDVPVDSEVAVDSNLAVDSLDTTPVAAEPTWNDTPQEVAPLAPPVDHRVQNLISRMEEMRSRGHNAPVSLQKKKSELFRLDEN